MTNSFKINEELNKLSNLSEELRNLSFTKNDKIKRIIENPYKFGIESFVKNANFKTKLEEKLLNLPKPSSLYSNNILVEENIELVWKLLKQLKSNLIKIEDLNRKDRKLLLNYYDLAIYEPEYFLQLLKTQSDRKVTTRVFTALLFTFYKHYSTFIQKNELKQAFLSIWDNYYKNVKRPLFQSFATLENYREKLFEKDFIIFISKACIEERFGNSTILFQEIINKNIPNIPYNSELYELIIKQIADLCYQNILNKRHRDIIIDDIISSNVIDKNLLDEIVSKIILEYNDFYSHNEIKKQIKDILIQSQNYGDPRINTINWANINDEARRIFLTWLAKDDLEFFFKYIFKDKGDTQHRKEFWYKYVNSKELISSSVILSNEDYKNLIRTLPDEELATKNYKKFYKESDNASCFILAFKNVIVVEFSLENHGLYIYDKDSCKFNVHSSQLTQSDLKYSYATRLRQDYFIKKVSTYSPLYKQIQNNNVPNIRLGKPIVIYHVVNPIIIAEERQQTYIQWHYITKRYLNYLGIYPGD